MLRRAFYFPWILASAGFWATGYAQQGHPLTGTWSGDWGPTPTERNQITLVMIWDGKKVSGLVNPGPDSMPLSSVFLDVTNWNVRIEVDAKDSSGKLEHFTAEGRLEDIGSYHRSIRGVWRQGARTGDFRITRD